MVARALGPDPGRRGRGRLCWSCSRGNFVSDTREKAFTETLAGEFPNIKLVGIQPHRLGLGQGHRRGADLADHLSRPEGRGLHLGSMCLAASAVAQAMDRKLLYGGYDGDEEMHPRPADGSMVMDVLTGAYRVGCRPNIAVPRAAATGEGEPCAMDLLVPTYFVTSDATAQAPWPARGRNSSTSAPREAATTAGHAACTEAAEREEADLRAG